jgi:hypothetical protein
MTADDTQMQQLAVGQRLASQVCDTEVIVVRGPDGLAVLTCGGVPMVPVNDPAAHRRPDASTGSGPGSLIGKRYGDVTGIELIVVRAGSGSLELDGTPLPMKPARPLPSSD